MLVLCKNEMKINIKSLIKACIIIIQMLIVFTPVAVTNMGIMGYLNYYRLLFLFIEVGIFFITSKKIVDWEIIICIIGFFSANLFITFKNNKSEFISSVNTMVLYLLSVITMLNLGRRSNKSTISIVYSYIVFIMFINLLSLIFLPDGFYKQYLHEMTIEQANSVYFLGVDNGFGAYIFPFISLGSFINYYFDKKIISSVILFSISILTYLISFSVTGLLAELFFLVIFFFLVIGKEKSLIFKIVDIKTIILFYIAMMYFLVFNNTFSNNGIIADIIKNKFGKSMTFSGRTDIWEKAINKINGSLLWGYGSVEYGAYISLPGTSKAFGAHNTVLQLLLQYGLVGVFFLILGLVICFYKFKKDKKFIIANKYFYAGVIAALIYYCFEAANIAPALGCLFYIYGFETSNNKRRINYDRT